MKKLLSLILFLASLSCFASTPITINIGNIGPVADLARNVSLGQSGRGGIGNNYMLNAIPGYSGVCLYINDTTAPGSTFALTANAVYTGDQTIPPQNISFVAAYPNTVINYQFLNGLTDQPGYWWNIPAAAQIMITIGVTNSSITDVGTAYVVFSNSPCGLRPPTPIFCNSSAFGDAATATTILLVSAPSGGQTIHVCSYTISGPGGISTTSAALNFTYTTTISNCTGASTTLWHLTSPSGLAPNFELQAGASEIFETPQLEELCYSDSGSTTGSSVSVSYAIF